MRNRALITSILVGVCAVVIAAAPLSGYLRASATENSTGLSDSTFEVNDKLADSASNSTNMPEASEVDEARESTDPAAEPVLVPVEAPQGTPADQVRSISDRPPLSSFTEQPFEEGFISLERMRSQTYELMKEDFVLAGSSDPYDYVADSINPYYDEIVALGPIAIPELKREIAESEVSGLEEYLFAIAIEEVAGADLTQILDPRSLPWSGKDFLDVWTKLQSEAPQQIAEIAKSDDLSLDEKTAKLGGYGALAIPQFMKLVDDKNIDPEVQVFMTERIAAWDLSDEELDALQE